MVSQLPSRSGRAALVILIVLVSAGATSLYLWNQSRLAAKTDPSGEDRRPEATSTVKAPAEIVLDETAKDEESAEVVELADVRTNTTAGSGTAPKTGSGGTSGKPLLADWTTPQLAFVITGQAHGYIEPCGCSERMIGGYSRRADFVRMLREDRKWPVIAVDVGGLLNMERVFQVQARWKLEALVKGLARMKYDALAVGTEELKFGPQKLFEVFQEFKNVDPDFALPFLGANLTIIDKSLGMPLDYTIVERGGKKVAIVSIFGDAWKNEVESFSQDELKVAGVEETLKRVLAEVQQKEKPDLYVLLSHDSLDNSKKWAGKFPVFQLVVSAGGYEEPPQTPEKVGNTIVVTSGIKGKTIGVVGYYPQDRAQPFKYTNIEVAPETLSNQASMTQVMREYQERLKDDYQNLIAESIPSERKFVGVDACKDCHTKAYEVWKNSKHANAYVAIDKGRKGQEKDFVSRVYDPECLCCHVVGWNAQSAQRIDSGFVDMMTTPHLAGQQCENCHGPGSEHVALETAGTDMAKMLASRKMMHRSKAEAEQSCRKCHDGENDIHWEDVGFENRWKEVAHPGLD